MRGRLPVSWARAQVSEGTADTVGLEASGCRRGCPGRLSPARGPALLLECQNILLFFLKEPEVFLPKFLKKVSAASFYDLFFTKVFQNSKIYILWDD